MACLEEDGRNEEVGHFGANGMDVRNDSEEIRVSTKQHRRGHDRSEQWGVESGKPDGVHRRSAYVVYNSL